MKFENSHLVDFTRSIVDSLLVAEDKKQEEVLLKELFDNVNKKNTIVKRLEQVNILFVLLICSPCLIVYVYNGCNININLFKKIL